MIKFNEFMSYNAIVNAYTKHEFPNAYCLLFNGIYPLKLLTTEDGTVITQENGKGLVINERPKL